MITPGLMSVLIRTNGKLLARERKPRRVKHRNRETMRYSPTPTLSEDSVPEKGSTTLLIGHPMIKNIQGTKLGEAVGH